MSSHGSPGAGAARGAGSAVLRMRAAAVNAAGGPARARVALTLAAVLAVNGADVGTVSATTGNLERAFGVGNTQIGLLLTVVSLTTAAFTLPAGILTDRVRRTRLLSGSIAARSVSVALPLLIAGAFLLGAPNPALDAARLDIMPSGLWGRAEAVRTPLRSGGEATAPLLFGYVSQYVFGGPGSASGDDGSSGASVGNTAGLEYAFLLFLGALLIAGLLALAGLRTYPRDVATAAASADAISRAAGNSGRQRTSHA